MAHNILPSGGPFQTYSPQRMSTSVSGVSLSKRGNGGGRLDRSPEAFDTSHKKMAAMEVLQSYEKLSWHSFARCESLQQTRLHFQNVVAGFTSDDEDDLVHWPDDSGPQSTDSKKALHDAKRQTSNSNSSSAGAKGKEPMASPGSKPASGSSKSSKQRQR